SVRWGLVWLAAVGGLLVAGCGGASSDKAGGARAVKPLTLTLANDLAGPQEVEHYADAGRRLSQGRITIRIVSRWRFRALDAETRLIGDVKAGRADLGWVGTRAWDSVGVHGFRALETPMLIDSFALERRVVPSRVTDAMLPGVRRA